MKEAGKTRKELLTELEVLGQSPAELEPDHRQAADPFRILAYSLPVCVYIVQDGKFRFVNHKFHQVTGFSQDELLGTDTLNLVFPDDRNMVRENAVQMLKGERAAPYEYRVLNRTGEVRWVEETVIPITYQGKRATLGNFIDISEHKRTEAELRQYQQHLEQLVADRIAQVTTQN